MASFPFRSNRTYPSRIVCLSAEAVEIIYALGAADRIVGVTTFARIPASVVDKPKVSGFSTVAYQKIENLKPDLIIAFSDVQADATRELLRRGYPVLATNQRSLSEICETIDLVGRVIGCPTAARRLVARFRSGLLKVARQTKRTEPRPRVYFEEWDEPLISGVRWVGELIEIAGGTDVFSDLRDRCRAPDRVVQSEEVVRRKPEIIVASWCGKRVEIDSIRKRPGWNSIPAVQHGRIYEIASQDLLQPGPGILRGLGELRRIIKAFSTASPLDQHTAAPQQYRRTRRSGFPSKMVSSDLPRRSRNVPARNS